MTLPAAGQLPLHHVGQAKCHVESVTDIHPSKAAPPLLQSPWCRGPLQKSPHPRDSGACPLRPFRGPPRKPIPFKSRATLVPQSRAPSPAPGDLWLFGQVLTDEPGEYQVPSGKEVVGGCEQ